MTAATAMPLYQRVDAYLDVINAIIENGGEVTPEIEAQLAAVEGDIKDKVAACIAHVRNLEALAKARVEEARRLNEAALVPGRAAERLKAYVLDQLQRADLTKVETHLGTARIQKNGRPSIAWPTPETIPDAYRRVRVELDGTKAYEAWKAGTLPEGFTVEQGSHLRIS